MRLICQLPRHKLNLNPNGSCLDFLTVLTFQQISKLCFCLSVTIWARPKRIPVVVSLAKSPATQVILFVFIYVVDFPRHNHKALPPPPPSPELQQQLHIPLSVSVKAEATRPVLAGAGVRAGEALQAPEVPECPGAGAFGERAQLDANPSQDLVPESLLQDEEGLQREGRIF